MNKLPEKPREYTQADFCGPFSGGCYILCMIDRYSKYPEIVCTKSTSFKAIRPKFIHIFARHAIPRHIQTDNGPPFKSNQIKICLLLKHDFEHLSGFILPLLKQIF